MITSASALTNIIAILTRYFFFIKRLPRNSSTILSNSLHLQPETQCHPQTTKLVYSSTNRCLVNTCTQVPSTLELCGQLLYNYSIFGLGDFITLFLQKYLCWHGIKHSFVAYVYGFSSATFLNTRTPTWIKHLHSSKLKLLKKIYDNIHSHQVHYKMSYLELFSPRMYVWSLSLI